MAVLELSQLGGVLVDLWVKIITWFTSGVSSYVWAVVLLTIAIKIIMTPLDFFNKKSSRKNTKMQAVIQPQLEKLKKQYGNDQALYNQKMTELYKANNYNVMGSCLFMLVNLALTLTIFISLLNGLNAMASIRIKKQYGDLKQTYYQTVQQEILNGKTEQESIEIAQNQVIIKYNEVKESWLWIKNIWKADTTTSSIPSFDEYANIAGSFEIAGETYEYKKLTDEQKAQVKAEYETIMNPLKEKEGKANGYYILLVLIVGTSILSQYMMQKKLTGKKDKNQEEKSADPTAGVNKFMLILMPVLLGSFALSSNSVFAIYLLTSQIISIATTPLIDLVIDKTEKKVYEEKKASSTPIYSRENLAKHEGENQKQSSRKKGDKND
ncbi:MAG: YidC/Oxa1 family membrane protein insertase [Christensenellales bacterium]|jgi:YidC/Oxa1 family membrane protein insertase